MRTRHQDIGDPQTARDDALHSAMTRAGERAVWRRVRVWVRDAVGPRALKAALAMVVSAAVVLAGADVASAATTGPNQGVIGGGTTVTVAAPGSGFTKIFGTANYGPAYGLTSSNQLYVWGPNTYGGYGDGTTTASSSPKPFTATGAMAGKTITSISAGGIGFTLFLTSDGTVYASGYNTDGQLGNNSTTNSSTTVAVSTSGVMAGKTITQISASGYAAYAPQLKRVPSLASA